MDPGDELRAVQRPAVGEGGVAVGELERGDEHVALPDREVRTVAASPGAIGGIGGVLVEVLAEREIGDPARLITAQADAGG